MISDLIKTTLWASLVMVCYVAYDEGVRPYVSALNETDQILIDASIPPKEKGTMVYHDRALAALQQNCTNGVYESSSYDFRCAVDSPLPYITYKMFGKYLEQ